MMEYRRPGARRILVAQFVLALVIAGYLLAGPEALGAVGIEQKVRGLFHRTQALPSGPAERPQPVADLSAPVAGGSAPTAAPVRTPSRPPAVRPAPVRRRPAATPAAPATPPPLSPEEYLQRVMREGYELYQGGWYGPAMARYKEAARVSPRSATVQLWYGRAALKAGRTDEARRALQRAIILAPASDAAREARTLLGNPLD
jgi:tetratricopeptide (TPR) repeat protein